MSLSARRVWIEMLMGAFGFLGGLVTLREEGVD